MAEPHVFKKPSEMTAWCKTKARAGRSLGLVPTMGALHDGHRSLIERARRENDRVVVSVFVNPTQFGPNEDFHTYPRALDRDLKLCAKAGVDAVFAPEPKDMYLGNARTWVDVGGLSDTLCGLSRPGHFRGVCTVVAKLFNIVRPDRAYFGRKDAQQLRILQAMARDLDFGVAVVPCEIVREADGLALSSRNKYLSPEERKQALSLSHALEHVRQRVAGGERNAIKLVGEMTELIQKEPDAEIDYVQIVDADTLKDVETIKGTVLVALAVKIGATRLIDNVELTV
jgi:pantoate--beta-alanine ligase